MAEEKTNISAEKTVKSEKILFILFISLGALIPLAYSLYTSHIWEDFFITFKCSKNLVLGNGMVYHSGEKVHAFTSPLGTLLPALCFLLTGMKSYLEALWLFRILFCIPAFIGAGFFLLKTLNNEYKGKTLIPLIFLGLLFLLDAKAVMFSVNGMETAFMLFFFALAIYFLCKDFAENWIITGLAWGGLMWTRPDSCIYIAAMMIVALLFSSEKKQTLISILKAAAVTTVVYLPWFIWAWAYFGSPVPHTVYAKGAISYYDPLVMLRRLPMHISWAFEPVYAAGAWPKSTEWLAYGLAFFCFLYWLIPLKDHFGRKLSFLFFLISLYFVFMNFPYPWYYPPLTMLGIIIIVNGIWKIIEKLNKPPSVAIAFLSILVLNFAIMFCFISYQMKMQQQFIESGVRKNVGLWLKDHKKNDDTVYLECLGYIGYFSEARMLDYPGLATPASVKNIKEKGCDFVTLIDELKPNWVVLRPGEAELALKQEFFRKDYQYVCHFSAVKNIEKAGYIPGVRYLYHDATFSIYKRTK